MNDRSLQSRLMTCGILLVLVMAGLGARLGSLHLGGRMEPAAGIRDFTATILAGRGTIHDAKGNDNTVALNLVVKDVCADPHVVVASNAVVLVAGTLSEKLDVAADELAQRLNRPNRRFAYVRRYVPQEEAAKILTLNLPGVFLNDTIVRHYPHRTFMCHVLGFVNYEGTGSAGVEQVMDRYLKGSSGYLESSMNAKRQELYWKRNRCVPALDGARVTLNLDQNVQYIVEKVLDDTMEAHRARGAWAIVQRIRTGEVLALASRPAFDPNDFCNADENTRLNRAIGFVYEPGSTFKVVAVSGALNEGMVTRDTRIDCENGHWPYAGRILRDAHPYGILDVADIVQKSSNIGTAKVAVQMGEKRLYEYLRLFGLGGMCGIDLPGEERGILHPVQEWAEISKTRIAIGQGIGVTALQVLSVYCAIANDGFMMRPYVVKSVARDNGSILHQSQPEVIGRPITERTASVMRDLLRRVTDEEGTGKRARVDGYEVAGKTGTAEKAVAGGYSSTDYVASFVGFLPAGSPEIGLIVVVDSPQPVHYGGVVAAPAFSAMAGQIVRCLDIPPAGVALARNR